MLASRGRHAKPPDRRGAYATLLVGLLVASVGSGGFVMASADSGTHPYPAGPLPTAAAPTGPVAALPGPTSNPRVPVPVQVIIPDIGVRSVLMRLGLTSQGTMEVPKSATVAGWYTESPRPGAIGSAIIAGHIDSTVGPGVFFRLRLLRLGNLIYIRRSDGTLAVFAVTAVRLYAKADFPADLVYGPVPAAALRLISCGGVFDHATGSYLSSVVAYAVEVATSSSPGHHGNRRSAKG